MNVLFPLVAGALLLALAIKTYARFIGRQIGVDDARETPAHRLKDGRDYVPTRTHVVFAHHFSVIAGAGPIVGPTLALAYGWGAPWLWIVLGCILFGAVHDMCSMFVSMREDGRSIADMCRRCLGNGGYILFVAFLILALTLVNAVFLNLSVKALLASYPSELLKLAPGDTLLRQFTDANGVPMGRIGGIATTSVVIITIFAPLMGWILYKKHVRLLPLYVLAGVVCVLSVVLGFKFPIFFENTSAGLQAPDLWRYGMSLYTLFACWLPVWVILQPRDFINVQILYAGVIMMLAGLVMYGVFGRQIPGELAFATDLSARLDPLWPFLFITIACGAISGFHSLASTGTTVKQISRESDVLRVGYGSMMLEGALALLTLLLVATALPRKEYIDIVFQRDNPILAFSVSIGYMLNELSGLPIAVGCVLGILVLEGFVVTTLDTSVRLCRYMLEELWSFTLGERRPGWFKRPLFNTLIAVGLMLLFAQNSVVMAAWKVFGAGNQLIAALALTIVSVWLLARGRSYWFALAPAILMAITTYATLALSIRNYLAPTGSGRWVVEGKMPLLAASCLMLLLASGVFIIAVRRFLIFKREGQASTGGSSGGVPLVSVKGV